LGLQNSAVEAFGILQPACLVVSDGLVQGLIRRQRHRLLWGNISGH
jgi:hypothetical protein